MSLGIPLLSRAHIQPGDRVCAAVSGGADSVALLLLLHEQNAMAKNALGVGLSAVHVHHGLRGEEADADLGFVEELCERLQVPLHVERVSVPERLRAEANPMRAETVEEGARILRYGVFERLICSGEADSVATAHTLDDQAETVLMKILRGAWTEGLSGIYPWIMVSCGATGARAPRQGSIVRPLLAATRAELLTYLEKREQRWRSDSSNSDVAFTRNRVRHQLLPLLREYNPSIERTLANMAELARDEQARWQAELSRLLPQLLLPGRPVRGGGRAVSTGATKDTVAMELERLRLLDQATRRRVLRAAALQLGARLSFADTARLLDLALGAQVKIGAKLHFPAGLAAERSARELRLHRLAPPSRE